MTGWMTQAACSRRPDLPWTTDTTAVPTTAVASMSAVCAGCPVMASCWAYAAAEDITGGYWAGIDRDTTTARSTTRRAARRPAGARSAA